MQPHKSPFSSMPVVTLSEDYIPKDKDILCGRGKIGVRNSGNNTFYDAVRDSLPRYTHARSRSDKSMVVASVVSSLHESGYRFIKQDKASKRYTELTREQAHVKTGHAIRDFLKNQAKKMKPSPKKQADVATISHRSFRSPVIVDNLFGAFFEVENAGIMESLEMDIKASNNDRGVSIFAPFPVSSESAIEGANISQVFETLSMFDI